MREEGAQNLAVARCDRTREGCEGKRGGLTGKKGGGERNDGERRRDVSGSEA